VFGAGEEVIEKSGWISIRYTVDSTISLYLQTLGALCPVEPSQVRTLMYGDDGGHGYDGGYKEEDFLEGRASIGQLGF
jgi:hypothetical protein